MRAVILGGTGTLGKCLARKLIDAGHEVVAFSRCELKQKQMASEFQSHPNLSFRLGDIRDFESLKRAFFMADVVFHTAALKHVDVLEANPEESVKTNILGTMNVADAAINMGVHHVVFSSTDKAVSPVNVYGMCKGISEKILLNRNSDKCPTKFSVFRWGNVLFSRGSVIPQFLKSLKQNRTAYITHPDMTRFWIRIEDAVSFMLSNYQTATEVMVPPIRAASVKRVIDAAARYLEIEDYTIQTVGMRPGEKIHEELLPGMCSKDWPEFNDRELFEFVKESAGVQ